MSFYAVKVGHIPGIYTSWSECEAQVKSFSGAKYKKFTTRNEAEDFVNSNQSNHNDNSKTNSATETAGKKRKIENISTSAPQSAKYLKPIMFMHDPENPHKVMVYTDGSAKARPQGPIAGVGVYWGDNHPWNVGARWKGVQKNNRAEIGAATLAIARAKNSGLRDLLICTDSKFTITCATEWGSKWRSNGWKLATGEPVKVKDIVEKMLKLLDNGINVTWQHVPGHRGVPGNEAADRLANIGAELPLDS